MAKFPVKYMHDTPLLRARRALHKLKSELDVESGRAKSVDMSRQTFDTLRQLTSSPSFDLQPIGTPEGAMGVIDGFEINENNAIPYGDAFIVYKGE